MTKRYYLAAFLLLAVSIAKAQLQAPGEFLPHEYGMQFTPHYLLADYVEHLAANSPNVQLQQYGQTNEARPLLLAFVSTPENLARLDEIRQHNLRRTGLLDGEVKDEPGRAIVWLSFGVHGNEAGASESSMAVLYELASGSNEEIQSWLENTIVIIDPAINPDGYSRYTQWYRQVAPKYPTPEMRTYEHDEPWPGGRTNHYLFDLNRDWAWQTQLETRQRLAVYHQWMPHIHVDYHEQFPNSPYYFAPAASPYHQYITDWQEDFQNDIGKNHARYFDKEGWLYFTREAFDLFYPSYGDTYPTFNGAIGMTYEQAGHGIAGRAVEMENGDTLTLKDRIEHHTATALSTIEAASRNAGRLLENFDAYFERANNNPIGDYKTFIISGDNPKGKLGALAELLELNQIRFGLAGKESSIRGFNYQTGKEESIEVKTGDLLISAYQPMSTLAQVLLEPEPELEDSLTYDITAWALPYAYGLKAYATKQRLEPTPGLEAEPYTNNLDAVQDAYAYLAEWSSVGNARFLAALLKKGVKVRYAMGKFSIGGQSYEPGTLAITAVDNRKIGGERLHRIISTLAREMTQPIHAVRTGFSDSGFDLGSGSVQFIEAPRIALLSGEGTSSGSYGEIWHFLEQELDYPVYMFKAKELSSIPLEDYNVLIMPEGSYSMNEKTEEALSEWISGGGRLIAIGRALSSLEGKTGFSLEQVNGNGKADNGEDKVVQPLPYSGQSRRYASRSIPGAIFRLELDATHPLAFGLQGHYHTLKTSSRAYQVKDNLWNVGYLGEAPEPIGFAGSEALEKLKNSMVFGVQHRGRGSAIYLVDNPLFRGFWENGKLLFSNALFFAGQ